MQIFQSNKFAKIHKKLRKEESTALQIELRKIVGDPTIGTRKTGILARVRVHKFKYQKEQKLIAYILDKSKITFISYGGHENFYRDVSI